MSKLRLTMAALAVIASAGIINCSRMNANHSLPEAGPELTSEAPGETEEQKGARLLAEKMQYRSSIVADLQEMSEMNYGNGPCSITEYSALKNLQHNQNTESAANRIENPSLSDRGVNLAAIQMVKDMNDATNKYCAVNLGARTADYALMNFMMINNQALDVMTSEDVEAEIDKNFPKAEHVATKILPVMKDLVLQINIEQRDQALTFKLTEHQEYREAIQQQLELLRERQVIIRASYTCDDTSQVCSVRDLAFGNATGEATAAMIKAEEALNLTQLDTENDPRIDEKNDLLKSTYRTLNIHLESARRMVLQIQGGERPAAAGEGSLDAAQAAGQEASARLRAQEAADAAMDSHAHRNAVPQGGEGGLDAAQAAERSMIADCDRRAQDAYLAECGADSSCLQNVGNVRCSDEERAVIMDQLNGN